MTTPYAPNPAALEDLLPPPPQPVGSYVPAVKTGNLIYTSGVLPIEGGKLLATGAVGTYTVTVEAGRKAARQCALNALSILKAELGSLKKIRRIVKLTGYVNSAPSFSQQPAVINGASDLLVEFFGDAGKHARAAVGVSSLPMNASVELDLIVEVRD
jgi:enamine deaminase RidA (YjgF/YER057c/UK114 family)